MIPNGRWRRIARVDPSTPVSTQLAIGYTSENTTSKYHNFSDSLMVVYLYFAVAYFFLSAVNVSCWRVHLLRSSAPVSETCPFGFLCKTFADFYKPAAVSYKTCAGIAVFLPNF